jgi:hypothetical protein
MARAKAWAARNHAGGPGLTQRRKDAKERFLTDHDVAGAIVERKPTAAVRPVHEKQLLTFVRAPTGSSACS